MNDRGMFIEQSFWRGEGLHVHPEFSNHTAASWMGNLQRQRCWMVLLLCRHPLVHNSSSLMPNLMGSKWRKGRKGKKNSKKKGEQIKPRRIYITLIKWNNSLIEHRQGCSETLLSLRVEYQQADQVWGKSDFSPFCRFFGFSFSSPGWVLVAID